MKYVKTRASGIEGIGLRRYTRGGWKIGGGAKGEKEEIQVCERRYIRECNWYRKRCIEKVREYMRGRREKYKVRLKERGEK